MRAGYRIYCICMGVLNWDIMAWHSSTIEACHIISQISKNRFTCILITQIKRELTLEDMGSSRAGRHLISHR